MLEGIAEQGIGIYSARVLRSGDGFHFEIELDGLEHPLGAVTLADCERFSRGFSETLDKVLEEGHPDWKDVLPVGIHPDNYTVEVNSAGAERLLRLPDDLERFRGQPLRIRYLDQETRRSRIGVFEGTRPREAASGEESRDETSGPCYSFMEYIPRRGGGERKRSRKRNPEKFDLNSEDVIQINLYLDF